MEPLSESSSFNEAEGAGLPVPDCRYEIVDGAVVVAPAGFRHGIVGSRILSALVVFSSKTGAGVVCGADLGCWMKNGNLRVPDVAFVGAQRYRLLSQDMDKFLKGAPDLAVEVLSPSDSVRSIRDKADEYFDNGAKSAWIVDPADSTVLVCHPGMQDRILNVRDELQDEVLLSGFSLPVRELFQEPDFLDR